MFVNYAHRGASEYFPENTYSSFYAGLTMGTNGIETDVRRTKDGVLILFHDDDMTARTGLSGTAEDYTWEELENVFVTNPWNGTKDKIVRFDDFLKYFGWRDITFAIELKNFGIAADVIALLEKYGMKEKTIITSFKYEELVEAYRLGSGYRLGLLYVDTTDEVIEKLKAIEAAQACPKAELTDKKALDIIKRNGFECRVWGIFNEEIMKNAVDIGVDGGMTVNFPDKLTEYLNSRSI